MTRLQSRMSRAVLVVVLTAVCFPLQSHADRSDGSSVNRISQFVEIEIESWKRTNKIDVDRSALSYISRELASSQFMAASPRVLRRLASAYLYEVRDAKEGAGMKEPIIDRWDLNRISLSSFLESQEKKLGFLRVTSTPAGREVLIDGRPSGKTMKEFVLPPGKYTVRIDVKGKPCEESVDIVNSETTESVCSRSERGEGRAQSAQTGFGRTQRTRWRQGASSQ